MIVTKNVHQFFNDLSTVLPQKPSKSARSAKSAKSAKSSKSATLEASNTKICVIMDEVDGMGGGDRGGIGQLLQIIDASMIPIICICNDRDNKKITSLARKCYDCSFGRLPQSAMVSRLQYICKKEQISLSKSELTDLVESSGGDMRQVACVWFL